MFIPPQLLAKAEILNVDFPRDARGTPTDDTLANAVTWLVGTFTAKRSLDLTLAITRKIGEYHCIRHIQEDGTIGSALVAELPHQIGAEPMGLGITIFGRAPITDIAQSLSGEQTPVLQVGMTAGEKEPTNLAYDQTLVQLAGFFPWYRKALQLPKQEIDTHGLINTCLQLGMPKSLLK